VGEDLSDVIPPREIDEQHVSDEVFGVVGDTIPLGRRGLHDPVERPPFIPSRVVRVAIRNLNYNKVVTISLDTTINTS